MPEMPDVLPGEVIESVWGNQIRDRSLQRYADETERDFLNAAPVEGELAWIISLNLIQVYDGTDWVDLIIAIGGKMTGELVIGPLFGITFRNDGDTDDKARIGKFAGGGWQVLYDDGGGGLQTRFEIGDNDMTLYGIDGLSTLRMVQRVAGNAANTLLGSLVVPAGLSNNDQYLGGLQIDSGGNNAHYAFRRFNADSHVGHALIASQSGVPVTVAITKTGTGGGNPSGYIQNGLIVNPFGGSPNYESAAGQFSGTVRNVFVGTTVPDNAWGNDGDIFIRYTA